MSRFVCVRMVQGNSMDLSLFQFDYDLTFAAFFLNADREIYGRFGSRSREDDATHDISIEGFAEALRGALEMHGQYPANKAVLRGKRGPAPRYRVPEEYPSLRQFKPVLDFRGKVARSCLHCHQIREAERLIYRKEGAAFPEEVMFPYPMPDVIGLSLDPATRGKVSSVRADSPAGAAGMRAGDQILAVNEQPILSIADVQWVLHNSKEEDEIQVLVERDGDRRTMGVRLKPGWRKETELSWRATSWDLRRMALGGVLFEEVSLSERSAAGLKSGRLALRAKHVGEYGEHAVAKKAGVQKGDILVEFDGQSGEMTESALLAYALRAKKPGERVTAIFLRGRERVKAELLMQ